MRRYRQTEGAGGGLAMPPVLPIPLRHGPEDPLGLLSGQPILFGRVRVRREEGVVRCRRRLARGQVASSTLLLVVLAVVVGLDQGIKITPNLSIVLILPAHPLDELGNLVRSIAVHAPPTHPCPAMHEDVEGQSRNDEGRRNLRRVAQNTLLGNFIL